MYRIKIAALVINKKRVNWFWYTFKKYSIFIHVYLTPFGM
jgi:hypothetical protein